MHFDLFFRVSQKLHKSTKYIAYFSFDGGFFDGLRDEKIDFQPIFHFSEKSVQAHCMTL
jgi:hypothetical protein